MDEQEFRAKLIKWDEKSLDKRVERWKELVPANYTVPLPSLLWEYVTEADDMFIRGHFMGVILLCAAVMELVLADQLRSIMGATKEEIEHFGLEQMLILSHRLEILNDEEARQLQELRKMRNYIVHANVGKLNQMAKRTYEAWGLSIADLDAGMFLQPTWGGAIDQDALKYIQLVRDITVKFYGSEEG